MFLFKSCSLGLILQEGLSALIDYMLNSPMKRFGEILILRFRTCQHNAWARVLFNVPLEIPIYS